MNYPAASSRGSSLWLFAFGYLAGSFECDKSQANIEKNSEETFRVLVNNIENEENALREARIMKQYFNDMDEKLCIGTNLTFEGKVWSVDFGSEYFVLRIGSNKGDTFFPFFYNYAFYENDEHANPYKIFLLEQ